MEETTDGMAEDSNQEENKTAKELAGAMSYGLGQCLMYTAGIPLAFYVFLQIGTYLGLTFFSAIILFGVLGLGLKLLGNYLTTGSVFKDLDFTNKMEVYYNTAI